jgi:two-component system, NtrC family, response regulator HydG
VLIRGESGTGKELAARALHYLSRRRSDPFIAVNCAAISETLLESALFGHKRGAFTGAVDASKGRFEAAGEGTLFLDEIGDMPLSQQPALLRVLEYRRFTPIGEHTERECRARFVFATNHDLREDADAGKFRQDLFYRINVATVIMPPLRTRLDDIPVLADYFCKKLSADMSRPPLTCSPEALAVLQQYDWPGNVRELRNILESSLMLCDRGKETLNVADLPAEIAAVQGGIKVGSAERHEREALLRALRQSGGNQTQAAKLLGWHRNTVRAKLRLYGISALEG